MPRISRDTVQRATSDGLVENGPGTLEGRQQVLIDRLIEMDTSYAEFLGRRN
jgi:hypothetical protein